MQAKFLQRLDNGDHIALHHVVFGIAAVWRRQWRNRRVTAKKRR
jgi:hypothetical protein